MRCTATTVGASLFVAPSLHEEGAPHQRRSEPRRVRNSLNPIMSVMHIDASCSPTSSYTLALLARAASFWNGSIV